MELSRQFDTLLYGITSPVVLVDECGRALGANRTGEQRLAHWGVLADPPLGGATLTLETLLPGWLALNVPVWVALQDAVLHVTPVTGAAPFDRETVSAVLEWFPDAGEGGPGSTEREKLRILQEASRAVNSSLILEDIFESLGEVLHKYIPYQEAVIVILDDSQNGIKIMVRILEDGLLEITGEHHVFAGYEPVVDRVLRHPVPHAYGREQLPESLLIAPDTASALVVPLINKGVVIGLIAMSTRSETGFLPHQQELLLEVSAQLAVAVENAKFYWQTQAQASREFLINQLTMSIRQSLDMDIILGTAVMELGKVMGVSRCYIRYFGDQGDEKAFMYQLPGTIELAPDALAFEKTVFGLRKDQPFNPFVLNDVRDCPEALAGQALLEAYHIKSLAVFPILIRDTLVGTISLHQCDAFRVWVAEDIALLRAMAEHLGVALHQAQLFLALEQQKKALEQTLEELQQAQMHLIQSEKMAVLGQFVAGIAHEVNTPLGTMVSNNATLKVCFDKLRQVEIGSDSREAPVDPGAMSSDQLFETIDSLLSLNKLASSRIQDIVRNLRNFARLDESELKTVDVHEGIDSTILLVKSSMPAYIEIRRRYAPDLPKVQCYPGLLNQVFMNLLVNAGHAIQDVGPDARAHAITLETAYNPRTERVRVTIRDTGKGIPAENLAKIFDPGFTTKGVGVGTGLGLALCYRIVEKHQGRMQVDSEPDVGTAFAVEIPVHPLPSSA